jgi:hypothetical protein
MKEINDSFVIIEISSIGNFNINKDAKEFNNIKIDKDNNLMNIKINRNEYYVLWRDPNFEGNKFDSYGLKQRSLFCIEEANMAIHFISSTEKALKFVSRRMKDKIIFITSIGKDLSGKRFIEIIREMYGFNIIVLFYSNSTLHLDWIKDFPNCLFTNKNKIYRKYVTNYKKEKLEELKTECESDYKFKLNKFDVDECLKYTSSNISFNVDSSLYIKQVKIYSKENNKYLYMIENGEIIGKDECYLWDVTVSIKNRTITFFSNGYYLNENNGNVIGDENMKEWNYGITEDNRLYFFCKNKDNINNFLTMEDSEIKLNKSKSEKNESFELIDFSDSSSLTLKIKDSLSSISISICKGSMSSLSDSNYS